MGATKIISPYVAWRQGPKTVAESFAAKKSKAAPQVKAEPQSLDDQIKAAILAKLQGNEAGGTLALAKELNKPKDVVGLANRTSNVVGGVGNPFATGGLFNNETTKPLSQQISKENLALSQGMTAVNQWNAGRKPSDYVRFKDDFAPSTAPAIDPHGMDYLQNLQNVFASQWEAESIANETGQPLNYNKVGTPYAKSEAERRTPVFDPELWYQTNNPKPNPNYLTPGSKPSANFSVMPTRNPFTVDQQVAAGLEALSGVFGPIPSEGELGLLKALNALQQPVPVQPKPQGFAPAQRATTGSTNDMRRRFGMELEGEPAPLEKLLQFFSRTRVSP